MDNPYKSIIDMPNSGPCIQKIILGPSQFPILTKTMLWGRKLEKHVPPKGK